MNKKFWATTFTLSGAIMGAGILGLPYVFEKSGLIIGLIWLIFLGFILLFVNLALGEITLRTRGKHQLTGYARRYLGKWGKGVMFFAVIFGIYSALLAYLVGEGESFSKLFPGNLNPLILGFAFWLVMTLLLREGLKELKKVETYGVLAIIIVIVGIFVNYFPRVELDNLLAFNVPNFAAPIGIVLFALLGFTSIPELREEIRGQEKLLKKAIIYGSLIPVFLHILFVVIFVGVLGNDVTEVATLSFGPIVTILGIFTMLTSYFVLSFSLKDTFRYDLRFKKFNNFLFTSIVPMVIYFFVVKFNLIGFSSILGIAGVVSGGITGILIILMNKNSKAAGKGRRKPEILVPMNWPIIIILSIIFILGIILQFWF